jgi:hypothetical protein
MYKTEPGVPFNTPIVADILSWGLNTAAAVHRGSTKAPVGYSHVSVVVVVLIVGTKLLMILLPHRCGHSP